MKYLLLLSIFVSLSLPGISQSDSLRNERYTVISKNRDTLIIKKCPVGLLLYDSWIKDPNYKNVNPVIILTADLTPYLRRKEE